MPHAVSIRPAPQDAPLDRPADEEPALLHEFFQRSARLWPDHVAVETPPSRTQPHRRRVSYAELACQTDALAGYLREYVTCECVVAVLLPRDCERVYLAQIGVLTAGAAYCCIDPTFPDAQIAAILDDSRPVAVLTDAEGAARLRRVSYECSPPLLDVVEWLAHVNGPVEPPPPANWLTPQSLAYVIYTSGTTGRPKGVMIEHGAIANLIRGELLTFPTTPEDRVGQNSSCAYDSSVEEIWMPLAAGATLVVMDDDVVRLGPDLVPWLRRERISVFIPPPTLLRTTGCAAPPSALPDLKRLHVGGEPLTEDVVERWAPGRCFVNDYGPTECSVVALRGVVEAGDPITIGRPVPGVHAWILDENLNDVPVGETGELCLSGVGLARGYLNDPAMTARKFPVHPDFGRIYRTGDLAHRDADGNFFCHGRIDAQVKVRGYRIELESIEAKLVECPGVREAACRVQGDEADRQIAAFIVPADPAKPPSFAALKSALRAALPPYAVPSRFGVLSELPRTVSGKLNRRDLPVIDAPVEDEATAGPVVTPRTPIEENVASAFRTVLNLRDAVSVEHDFFHDLGGDSLRAAMTISLLRDDPATAALAVRDLYETRTAAALAARARPAAPPPKPAQASRRGSPVLATLAQTAWLLVGLFVLGPLAYLVVFHAVPDAMRGLGAAPFVLAAPLLGVFATAAYSVGAVTFAVGLKWLLIGRYCPRREPVWGAFYVRNWMVSQAVRLIPWKLISETAVQVLVLRLLGAKIGRRVHLHWGVNLLHGGWDLLQIGDDATLSRDAAVRVADYEDGQIVFAPVIVGAGCTLDVRAAVAGGGTMEPDSYLTAHSFLPAGATVPAGQYWSGIPAAPAGPAPERPELPAGTSELPPWLHAAAVLGRAALAASAVAPLLLLLLAAAAFMGADAAAVADWFSHPSLDLTEILLTAAAAVLAVPASLLWRCLSMRTLGRVPEGVISRWSLGYVRVILKADVVEWANEWLNGTLMWRLWLRGAGMRVGRNSEFSTIFDTVPELVEVGSDTFLADGIYLAGPRLHRGTVTLLRTRLGSRVFLGNYAVVPVGAELPDDTLLGVCTVADAARITPGTSWFGNPPFQLPRREVIEADAGLTHRPSWPRYANRVFWELLRFTLPLPPILLALGWLWLVGLGEERAPLAVQAFVVVPALELALLAALPGLGLALKWALLGRVRPGTHALWSFWCSRWDFNYTAWHHWVTGPLSPMEGTLWMNAYLRALGVKVGQGVMIFDPLALVVDPDMLTLEDGATVGALFQAHTFEDRVLKIDRVRIGRGATVGTGALLLYGADAGEGAWVVPHSVVMKHERLHPGHAYVGHPTRLLFQGQGQPDQPHQPHQPHQGLAPLATECHPFGVQAEQEAACLEPQGGGS